MVQYPDHPMRNAAIPGTSHVTVRTVAVQYVTMSLRAIPRPSTRSRKGEKCSAEWLDPVRDPRSLERFKTLIVR